MASLRETARIAHLKKKNHSTNTLQSNAELLSLGKPQVWLAQATLHPMTPALERVSSVADAHKSLRRVINLPRAETCEVIQTPASNDHDQTNRNASWRHTGHGQPFAQRQEPGKPAYSRQAGVAATRDDFRQHSPPMPLTLTRYRTHSYSTMTRSSPSIFILNLIMLPRSPVGFWKSFRLFKS